MSMNVSTTTAAYANYQNNYKTGTANKKKETAQTTENTKLKENTTESIAEKNLSKAAQKMLETLQLKPVINAGMRLGEGTGASLAISILRTALDTYRDITGA